MGFMSGGRAVAELLEVDDLAEIAAGFRAASILRPACPRISRSRRADRGRRLLELSRTGSRRNRHCRGALDSLGVRAGDRIMIVSENCIALAGMLLAASRIDAWAIVANPRLSARELDQICDHSGARRMLFTAEVSREAAAHASAVVRRSAMSVLSSKSASRR